MKSELIKHSAIYIGIDTATKALTFFLWIILAWLLVPSQIAQYTLAQFLIEFFTAISILGLDSVILRFYHNQNRDVVLSNALSILIPSIMFTALLFLLSESWISLIIVGLSTIIHNNLLLIAAIIITTPIANVAIMHYIALQKTSWYAKILFVKVFLLFFSAILLAYLGFGVKGLFIAQLISTLSVAILFILKERDTISTHHISYEIFKKMAHYGIPLMFTTLSGILAFYFGRLLLDRYASATNLGIYSFFLTLTLQINKGWTSFNQAWTPKIFSDLSNNVREVQENVVSMAFVLSFLYLIGLAALVILGELFLFRFIFNEVYRTHIHTFYILLLAPLFSGIYIVAYPLYYYGGKTKRILYISFSLALAEILVTFFLVQRFNETGAALSIFLMYILIALVYLSCFKTIMQIPSKIINWTLVLSLLTAASITSLLKTSSVVLFLIPVMTAALLAFFWGELYKYTHTFVNFLNEIRGR